jgi:hypothetical protein
MLMNGFPSGALLSNNLTTTSSGTALDAYQGYLLQANKASLVGAEILTNKAIIPRYGIIAYASNITPNVDLYDQVFCALAGNVIINAPTGSPVPGQHLIIMLYADTVRTIGWNAAFVPVGVDLPISNPEYKTIYVGCIYNSAASVWNVIAVGVQL